MSDTKGKQDYRKKCAYQTTLLPETLGKTPSCEWCKAPLPDTTMRLPGSTRDRGLGAGPSPGGREVCGVGQEIKSEEGVIKRNVSKDIGRCLLTRWLGKLPTRRSSPLCLLPNSQYERIRSSPGDKTEEDCSSGLHRRLRVVAPRSQAKIHALNILWKTKQSKTHSHTQMTQEGLAEPSLLRFF